MSTPRISAAASVAIEQMTINTLAVVVSLDIDTAADCPDWYALAREWAVANRGHLTVAQAVDLLAVLSQGTSWDKNRLFFLMARDGYALEITAAYPVVRAKAAAIVADPVNHGAYVGGDKIRAFRDDLLGNIDWPCIDRHQGSICHLEFINTLKNPYHWYALATQAAAKELGCSAVKLQFLTWCAWRTMKGMPEDMTDDQVAAEYADWLVSRG